MLVLLGDRLGAHLAPLPDCTGSGRVVVIRRSDANGARPLGVMGCSCRDRSGDGDGADPAVGQQRHGSQVQTAVVIETGAGPTYVVVGLAARAAQHRLADGRTQPA